MPPPNKPDQTVPIGNSLFVSKLGTVDGVRARLDKCFLDIPSAVDAAQSGDTVFVYGGNYSLSRSIQLKPFVNFQFLGSGSVYSEGDVFSDLGQTAASENFIFARGWTFQGGEQVLDFNPKSANRKASLYFEFNELIGNEAVAIYHGEGQVILDGRRIYSADGTPVQVNAGNLTIRNAEIKTDTRGNGDAILLWANLDLENVFCHSTGTDCIGMDGGRIRAKNSTFISDVANALTLRNEGSGHFQSCNATGHDAALTVAEALTIESDNSNYHCTGVGKNAVEIYRSSTARINLRGGRVSSVKDSRDFDLGGGNGEITVAGTVWDRSKGLPTLEWIPGEGWRHL